MEQVYVKDKKEWTIEKGATRSLPLNPLSAASRSGVQGTLRPRGGPVVPSGGGQNSFFSLWNVPIYPSFFATLTCQCRSSSVLPCIRSSLDCPVPRRPRSVAARRAPDTRRPPPQPSSRYSQRESWPNNRSGRESRGYRRGLGGPRARSDAGAGGAGARGRPGRSAASLEDLNSLRGPSRAHHGECDGAGDA